MESKSAERAENDLAFGPGESTGRPVRISVRDVQAGYGI